MITLDMVHTAYIEYSAAMDKVDFAYRNGGATQELVAASSAAWDNYKELSDIYESGGLVEDWL